jgi:type II secretory pathway pseudopilin PulG
LVELLIAATMMAVLFVGLTAHLQGGVAVWRQATVRTDRLQRRRVALDRLARDVANALVYDARTEAYGAEVGRLPPPQFGAQEMSWFTVRLTPAAQLPTVQFVTWRCDTLEGVTGLWRVAQSVNEARAQRPAEPELILSGCQALAAQYAYQPDDPSQPVVWRAEWDDAERTVPRLVKVALELDTGEELARTIAIPAGELPEESPG